MAGKSAHTLHMETSECSLKADPARGASRVLPAPFLAQLSEELPQLSQDPLGLDRLEEHSIHSRAGQTSRYRNAFALR